MVDSIRQQIMDAVDARLKAILVTGGYTTDIGDNVFDWKADALEEGDLPALIYRDTSVETVVDSFVGFLNRMRMTISAICTDATPMAVVREIIADIDKAIGVDPTWGGLALTTERIGDESEVEIQEKKFAGCQIEVVIIFRVLVWNDYTKY